MATRPRTSRKQVEATALLIQDHKAVKRLFRQYERTKDSMSRVEKRALAEQICGELTIHAQIEEEVFYPAARGARIDSELLDEAEVEHSTAKHLIAAIRSMEPSEPLYDANVKVLGEYVDHHVKEEEDELFPKARSRKAGLDLVALAERMTARKAELTSEASEASEAPAPPARRPRAVAASRA
jgi:hemerythrin superfamily protein